MASYISVTFENLHFYRTSLVFFDMKYWKRGEIHDNFYLLSLNTGPFLLVQLLNKCI